MKFKSHNPYTGEVLKSHKAHSKKAIKEILEGAEKAFEGWKKTPLAERTAIMERTAEVLIANLERCAKMISLEMGKPITEARAEVQKCAAVCRYYAAHAATFLADEPIATEASKSMVRHHPIGCVFGIMPWNFPFWQVFRFAAPTLTAGNVVLLKHAQNVFGCARLIEEMLREAGLPEGVFQVLITGHEHTEMVVAHPMVQAISLTGSERAGAAVAEIAGRYLKKSLLELGGSNAYIVLADADIGQAVATGIQGRMLNTGQSCIAAKRFIIVEEVYEEFVTQYVKATAELKSGDPMLDGTQIGVLARPDLAEALDVQVKKSVKKGAKLLLGGNYVGANYAPTVLGEVRPGMPAFDEETFGPVAAMVKAKDMDEAYALSQQSKYALGVTVCTADVDKALQYADRVCDGAYFINEFVKSDPRLPFGGQRNSGFGRELAKDGMMEFVNRQTIYVK